jgi:hypothetical protein
MSELKNDFSWSKSRDEVFRKCPRQYYFQYYGSWGGWKTDCDQRTREIYVLKQLQSRSMWAGSKVHDCIKRALENLRRGIKPMPEKEAIDATLASMRNDFANSRRGDYWKNPKTCGFFEHEYKLNLSKSAWKETADHAVKCLQTFYQSDVYKRIQELSSDQWLETEEFSSFQLESTKIHVVLDFSYRDTNGDIVIYDWKTGRSDSERNDVQLACYSYYATQKWAVDAEKVKTIEFNLASGRAYNYSLIGKGLESILHHIRGSIRDMKMLLDNPETNQANEDRFAFTTQDTTCNYCNYRKVCPRITAH